MADDVPIQNVLDLRDQGLTDNLIAEELKKQGFAEDKIESAISLADNTPQQPAGPPMGGMPSPDTYQQQPVEDTNVYERIEQITEGLIDQKWDELIIEVKKIIDWKEKFENNFNNLVNDFNKMKDDFKTLHQGVLGKLEDYDTRMVDVKTELNAVGKVFKDVVPEFVDNVKQLKSITGNIKKKD